ncbi:MAG: dihydroxyacetone kinase subunit DhaK [Tepidanaerobacteraceae bacterium]|jgi:dihydroxyacetone kinase-like protein|nr:dihydroxyacetone kinase subunit DhaK [Tepidanaerobacteraceae bacterium]
MLNKIINSPDEIVKQMIEGYLCANSVLFDAVPNTNGIVLKEKKTKVAIVTGGGAGNEPWNIGYAGYGLADGVAIGHVYAAPPTRSIISVAKATNYEKGILFIANNYAGDVLNFELAAELLQMEGIKARCVFVSDDVASAPPENADERRGIAGIALVLKIAGAAADAGLDLDRVEQIAKKANRNIHTLSATTSPGYMPNTGEAMFRMDENTVEIGMGFNGEPGIFRMKFAGADKIVDVMMDYLLNDLRAEAGREVAVFVNGFGLTGMMELCIVNRRVGQILQEKGIVIHDMFIDMLFVPPGAGGFSISLLKLDDELKQYYDCPAYSPFFRKAGLRRPGVL